MVRIDVGFIILGAIATSWAIEADSARAFLAIVGAASLALGTLLTLAIKLTQLDRTWFASRAIAESVKTLAWRYMTRAQPYGPDLEEKDADEVLAREIGHVLEQRRAFGAALASKEAVSDQITEAMRFVRQQPAGLRKAVYLRDRIRNQQNWYATRGRANTESSSRLLIAVAISQSLAILAAILLVRWPEFDLNFASILSATAASILAWLQLRRHQDLSLSYGLAAHELGLILAREKHVVSDGDLSDFVGDAENAVSREHTMWLARRDTL